MSSEADHRAALMMLAGSGKSASIYSSKNGTPCVSVGRVRSLTETHVVIAWDSGETILPVRAITRIEESKQ